MPLSYQEIAVILILLFGSFFCALIGWKKPKSKSDRTNILWKLAILNISAFSSGLIALVYFLPQSSLNILSWVVYDFLITYVLCVELPAYLRISNFDDKFVDILKGLRKELIEMPFAFDDHLRNLKTKRNSAISSLKGENLDNLLENFIAFSDKIENYNEKVWALTLSETSALIDEVAKRSKHPFPKLIDILALSGLSLLLAQFLNLFG